MVGDAARDSRDGLRGKGGGWCGGERPRVIRALADFRWGTYGYAE